MLQAGVYRGWAVGGAHGLGELQQSLAGLEAAGVKVFLPWWLRIAAEANRGLGRLDDAQVAVEAALRIEEETGGRAQFAELQRLEGEILLQRRNARKAESCFRRALEVAREHQTKSIELRAATSLASLLRDQDRGDQARALLQPVYDWFTEGFDTADLKDARRLLDELVQTG